MLFNSLTFLFAYLPIALLGYFMLARQSQRLAAAWLGLASLFFYGWWDYRYIPLLLFSILFNYFISKKCHGRKDQNDYTNSGSRSWLTFAIATNLILLSYYKYADFFLLSANSVFGTTFSQLQIILPIGISFFTFTQIAFLVDTYQGKVRETNFIHYLLFVTYFPHLIAGPVLHHKEMMPQFANPTSYKFSWSNWSIGLTIFFIGLAKKVLLADNLSPYAADLFDRTPDTTFFLAWNGLFAYSLQLYFDFSGYSDMAIGLSRLFGVRLPLNFNSPYKAGNISQFWRCWHMTLSRFLRDYLYIPLGGNRCGKIRKNINLLVTMLLGGLWHGAGWNFIIWGGLHGVYLVFHHLWDSFATARGFSRRSRFFRIFAIGITFLSTCIAWVFFRSTTLPTAWAIILALFGVNGAALPEAIGLKLGVVSSWLELIGVKFYIGGGGRFIESWSVVLPALIVAFTFPNTQEMLHHFRPALDDSASLQQESLLRLRWRPNRKWSYAIAGIAIISLLAINQPTEFLYFQF